VKKTDDARHTMQSANVDLEFKLARGENTLAFSPEASLRSLHQSRRFPETCILSIGSAAHARTSQLPDTPPDVSGASRAQSNAFKTTAFSFTWARHSSPTVSWLVTMAWSTKTHVATRRRQAFNGFVRWFQTTSFVPPSPTAGAGCVARRGALERSDRVNRDPTTGRSALR